MQAYEDWINLNLAYMFQQDHECTVRFAHYDMKGKRHEYAFKADDGVYLEVVGMSTNGKVNLVVHKEKKE